MKKSPSKCQGTQEWSVKTVNCCNGCSHDCLYCYAKEMAVRRKQLTLEQWPLEQVRKKDVYKPHKKYPGQVMFPSSHDITDNILNDCENVIWNLVEAGNRVLIVSKPHFSCIEQLCVFLRSYSDQILFRFTIGACDNRILSFWEPNAPSYDERKQCLIHAHQAGFNTSVSVEPMLDSANIDALISDLSPYVTHSIWIGTMNHLGRLEKHADPIMLQAIDKVRRGQSDPVIKAIYQRHKDNPMIRWKKGIKKVVGIPIPKQNGLDI